MRQQRIDIELVPLGDYKQVRNLAKSCVRQADNGTIDHLVVSDLASSNGTFVNGKLIREPVELVDGDTLSIAGSRQYRVCIDGTVRRESAAIVDSARTPVDS